MLFSSITFLFYFLPLLFLFYFCFRKNIKIANIVLLVGSLIFYAWGEPIFVVLMLTSIIMNYITGRFIDKLDQKKLVLTLGIIGNLGLLFYFKYFSFAIANVSGALGQNLTVPNIALPLGISFFTFQAITYLVDLYRGEIKVQKNLFNLALYISLFPQLIAGPIVRYHDIEKQITKRSVTSDDFYQGVRRFIIGFSKKILIANTFGQVADEIFALPNTDLTSVLIGIAIVAYTIQIYFDFSAYSDMAIGLGRMFGFKLLENFNYPYISRSVREFWQRWHISLSTFLRDYLYIPLGGNQKGELITYRNLITVFLLCGLWHGAGWTFLLWGTYFGLFLIIERMFLGRLLSKLPNILSWLYALVVIMFGWLLFRAETVQQFTFMSETLIAGTSSNLQSKYTGNMFLLASFCAAIIGSTPVFRNLIMGSKRVIVRIGTDVYLIACFITSIGFLAAGTYNPFIYFRF